MSQRKIRYFVNPRGRTNEVVCAELSKLSEVDSADQITEVGGKQLHLIEISSELRSRLADMAKSDSQIKGMIYTQEGSGAIRLAPNFLQLRPRKKRRFAGLVKASQL